MEGSSAHTRECTVINVQDGGGRGIPNIGKFGKFGKLQVVLKVVGAVYMPIGNLLSTHRMTIKHIKNVVYHMTNHRTNQKQLPVMKQLPVVPCDL